MPLRSYDGIVSQRIANQSAASASVTDVYTLAEGDFDSVTFKLNVSAVSATGGTLDVYIQTTIDGGTNWLDCGHFAQISASSASDYYMTIPVAGAAAYHGAGADASLTASSAAGLPLMSRSIRVKGVIATTAFTYTVDALFNNISKAS